MIIRISYAVLLAVTSCRYEAARHGVEQARSILNTFTPERLPVMSALAQEFAVMDHFFCSHPGPTFPNRLFHLMGTSHGDTETEFLAHPVPCVRCWSWPSVCPWQWPRLWRALPWRAWLWEAWPWGGAGCCWLLSSSAHITVLG